MGRIIPSLTEGHWGDSAQNQIPPWVDQKVPNLWADRLWYDRKALVSGQTNFRFWHSRTVAPSAPISIPPTHPDTPPSARNPVECSVCHKWMNSHMQLRQHVCSTGHLDRSSKPPWRMMTNSGSFTTSIESEKHCKDSYEASLQNSEYLARFPEGTVLWNENTWLRHPHNDWGHCNLRRNVQKMRCWECWETLKLGGDWRTGRNIVDRYNHPIYGVVGIYNVGRNNSMSAKQHSQKIGQSLSCDSSSSVGGASDTECRFQIRPSAFRCEPCRKSMNSQYQFCEHLRSDRHATRLKEHHCKDTHHHCIFGNVFESERSPQVTNQDLESTKPFPVGFWCGTDKNGAFIHIMTAISKVK